MKSTTNVNIKSEGKGGKKLSDAELLVIWAEFAKDRTNKVLRDKLIVQYIYLIKYVVNRLRANLPTTISTDDIAGYGVERLINAIERFESDKGARLRRMPL